jgi:hypothetical protein
MDIKKTNRGFEYTKFVDLYGFKCSLQKSSLATEDAIWFGVDDTKPQILRKDGKGWQPIELPTDGEVLISGRMHLSQEQVKQLLPYLKNFVDTGELET